MKAPELRVFIVGAGKVGASLSRALRARGVKVTLRAARTGLAARPIGADLLILAVRDGQLEPLAPSPRAANWSDAETAVVHCAGALGPEPLAPLRAVGVWRRADAPYDFVCLAHARCPRFGEVRFTSTAIPRAVRVARRVARLLGMTPRTLPELDKIAYHAAAGLVANGAAALAAAGDRASRRRAASPRDVASLMLGPLAPQRRRQCRALGLPAALTGPVRRGDAAAVRPPSRGDPQSAPELVAALLERWSLSAAPDGAQELGDADPAAPSTPSKRRFAGELNLRSSTGGPGRLAQEKRVD